MNEATTNGPKLAMGRRLGVGGNVCGDSVLVGRSSTVGEGFDHFAGAAGELPLPESLFEKTP